MSLDVRMEYLLVAQNAEGYENDGRTRWIEAKYSIMSVYCHCHYLKHYYYHNHRYHHPPASILSLLLYYYLPSLCEYYFCYHPNIIIITTIISTAMILSTSGYTNKMLSFGSYIFE